VDVKIAIVLNKTSFPIKQDLLFARANEVKHRAILVYGFTHQNSEQRACNERQAPERKGCAMSALRANLPT
jgi:hypothetical protein